MSKKGKIYRLVRALRIRLNILRLRAWGIHSSSLVVFPCFISRDIVVGRHSYIGPGSEIGPVASPDKIQFAPGLPKTRSGKIMRRILRKIAEDDFGSLGDTSTLADPAVVDDLIENRQNKKS